MSINICKVANIFLGSSKNISDYLENNDSHLCVWVSDSVITNKSLESLV